MRRTSLSVPEIAIIGGTRAAFGAGLGLLLAGFLNREQRRSVGWTLLAIGAVSTIPIAIQLVQGLREYSEESEQEIGRRMRQEEYAE